MGTGSSNARVGDADRTEKSSKGTKLNFFEDSEICFKDTLHKKAHHESMGCSKACCHGSSMLPVEHSTNGRSKDEVLKGVKPFFEEYFASLKKSDPQANKKRLQEVTSSIQKTGTYELTYGELEFGCRTAWRNSPRCIGRIHWSSLKVFDARHVRTASEMRDALFEHLKYCTNGGNIRSCITVFPSRTDGKHDFRVWNPQLIRYAGYEQPDGSVVGDPVSVELTKLCVSMGWKAPGGRFDILPLILQANGDDPELFDLPSDLALEVAIEHPDYPSFKNLGLKWLGVPAVAALLLDIGGLEFTAAPSNGWYMSTEVAARDFCDVQRYNLLPDIAKNLKLDTSSVRTLWKDQALVEVNKAVLYSYGKAGVTVMDHHTASESFMQHVRKEYKIRGGCPADWVWIVPPVSGGICPVFHLEMLNYKLKPSFEYQVDPWKTHIWKQKNGEKNDDGL